MNKGLPNQLRWTRSDFRSDPVTMAQRLIGAVLVRTLDTGERLSGMIVETEAYLGIADKAAHSFGGRRTARTEPMFAQPGTAYVYFTYGMHHCMNVVCGAINEPVAVLIRALEPIEGHERIRENRLRGGRRKSSLRDTDLCSGPAKICQGLSIDRELTGIDLTSGRSLQIEHHPNKGGLVPLVNTPRIGIDFAEEWAIRPLRWHLQENRHVSRN